MKKKYIIFIVAAVVLLGIIIFIVCRGNRPLVLTKTFAEGTEGEYEDKTTVKFKKNVATTIDTEYTCSNDKIEDEIYNIMMHLTNDKEHNSEFTVERDGNVLKTHNNMKSFVNYKSNFSKNLTKEEIKEWFVKEGYTVVSE